MKKKFLSILLVLVLVLSFSLVTAVPVAAYSYDSYTDAITKTADRLVALQGTDGGWDWVVTGLTEHSMAPSGANLYGVTALGLIDAYQVTGDEAYKTAAQLTGDHLKTLSRATDSAVRIQSFDYRFLVEFSALSGDGTYAAHALSEWNWVKVNVAFMDYLYADGNQATIYGFWFSHAGYGFAAWQAADMGLAALAMGDTSWADNMATELATHLDEIADSDIYRFIGWGHALEFLNAVDSTTYGTAIGNLVTELTGSQNSDGSWGTGENSEGYTQDAAYAIMGLAAAGRADATAAAEKGADWLITNQDYSSIVGGWNNSTDNKEYSESDSEALQALVAVPTKAFILKDSGVPGKGLDTAPGQQKAFNPNSKAGEHAGKKDK